jgi:hypothetical protein
VSVKLTPEICINKASSNSRLTAAGRLFFFFLFSFEEATTELHLHAEKLTETVLHLNLEHFVVFCLFWFFWGFFSPLMRQQQNYF